ncbi:MAG: phosphatidate cytidylyltransferase [Piscinibacter sp.]
MLKQRVITAIVLLALLLPALFAASPWPFAVLTLLLIGAAGWEWGRLNGMGASGAIALGVAVAAACAAAIVAGWASLAPAWLWWPVALLWLVGGAQALRAGPSGWPQLWRPARLALGVLLLVAAWIAMANARTLGLNFLLSAFCLVWMADIAAYFGGRAFGRRKLAPTISPGKSWEGAWCGAAGVVLLGLAWRHVDRVQAIDVPSLFTRIDLRWGVAGLIVALVVLAAMSVVGDLFESLVKRAAGAKDSSGLLPGHGGVLDRVDALLPVLPVAMALATS